MCSFYKNLAVKADRRTNLSPCEVLDCSDPSLDAAVRVAVSDRILFVHDFGWDLCVPAPCFTSMMLGSWSLCSITF